MSGSTIEGKVEQILLEPYQGENPTCSKCEGERKDKKVIGMNFFWGFRWEGSSWSEGEILDPASGKVYSSRIWMKDINTMQVRGYAGPLNWFYRTQTWKRVGTSLEQTPLGMWQTLDDYWNLPKALVEVKEVNGELRGFVRKIYLLPHEGPDPVCTKCDGSLKNSKVLGMTIIWDFRKEGEMWVDGKILDPGNGNVYSASLWLVDSDTLKVRGFPGPFYRSQVWKRTP